MEWKWLACIYSVIGLASEDFVRRFRAEISHKFCNSMRHEEANDTPSVEEKDTPN